MQEFTQRKKISRQNREKSNLRPVSGEVDQGGRTVWSPVPIYIGRRPTRLVQVGDVLIGSDVPVSVQSMTTADTRKPGETVAQIQQLQEAGCDLVRVAVPDETAAGKLAEIREAVKPPLIADIHYSVNLALAAIDAGMEGIRINPGTIGDHRKLESIAKSAAAAGAAVRIGINGGSLERDIKMEYKNRSPAEALVASALRNCENFEEWGCANLKVSLKSSSPLCTIAAYRQFAALTDYPLHLGLTEAGLPEAGTVKSAAVLGCLLLEGIGDTLRVSLTGDPVREVFVGRQILAACGLRDETPEIISCPTCGRTEIDVVTLAREVEAEVRRLEAAGKRVAIRKIAVMGCSVNGPGEAREADIGIACGRDHGVLFKEGKIAEKLSLEQMKERLFAEIRARAEQEC